MNVFDSLSEVKKDKNTVVTIGTFDGIHLGHKKIIEKVIEKTSGYGGRNFVVTFDPHPRSVVSNGKDIKLLNTLEEKLNILSDFGIQNMLVIKFTKEFSQLSSEEFFKKYIIDGIGIKEVVIGYDHHFGKGRGGDKNTLDEMGIEFNFNVTSVDAVSIDGTTVSSTKIRNALNEGNVKQASMLLGRYYSFGGKVIKGDQRGRLLGFPTANIKLDDENKLLPLIGIYAVEFIVNSQKHFGLMSIGKRPTFYNDGSVTTEVYIFDFNDDIYDKSVTVNLVDRIRGEEKYSSAEKLIEQMNKDKEAGLEIFSKLVG